MTFTVEMKVKNVCYKFGPYHKKIKVFGSINTKIALCVLNDDNDNDNNNSNNNNNDENIQINPYM